LVWLEADGQMTSPQDASLIALVVFAYGVPVCAISMALFGLPLVLWLRAKRLLYLPMVCLGGVLGGTLVAAVTALINDSGNPLLGFLPAAAAGLFASLVFCMVARIGLRRPA